MLTIAHFGRTMGLREQWRTQDFFVCGVQTLVGSLVLWKTKDFYVDFEGGPTIFNEFFETHLGLTGAAAPMWLCLGLPLCS